MTPINATIGNHLYQCQLPAWFIGAWLADARHQASVGLSDDQAKMFLTAGLARGEGMEWTRAASLADLALATNATEAKQLAGQIILVALDHDRSERGQAATAARMSREWATYQAKATATYLRNRGRTK